MAKGSSLGIQVAVAEAMDAVLHARQMVQGREGEISQRRNMALCLLFRVAKRQLATFQATPRS